MENSANTPEKFELKHTKMILKNDKEEEVIKLFKVMINYKNEY